MINYLSDTIITGAYELNLIVPAGRVIVAIPAHSTIMTLIVQSSGFVSAPHSNWIVTGLSTVEIPDHFTIAVVMKHAHVHDILHVYRCRVNVN